MTKKGHCLGVVAFHEGVFTIWIEDDILIARGPASQPVAFDPRGPGRLAVTILGTPPSASSQKALMSHGCKILNTMLEKERDLLKRARAIALNHEGWRKREISSRWYAKD
jgi:hypothetical protein